jgi:hypothetical protein
MKKYIYYVVLGISMIVASCNADIDIEYLPADDQMVNINIVASNTEDTRIYLNGNRTEWEVGDTITVALTSYTTKYYPFTIESIADISDDGNVARFSGAIPAGYYTKAVAIFPAITDTSSYTTLSRQDDAIYMAAIYDDAFIVNNSSASIPMSFSHLMHKIDYNITLASDFTSTNISNGVAIEMVAKSNDNEFSMPQCYTYNLEEGYMNMAVASSSSHVADFATHNFLTNKVASALIFPTTIRDAELLFNVYIKGEKAHTIVKNLDRDLTMSEGGVTKINLELNEQNRYVEETSNDIVADPNIDAYLSSIFYKGSSSWGNKFSITGPNDISFDLHIATNYSANGVIAENEYDQKSTSFFSNSSPHFAIRSAKNLPNIPSNITSLNGDGMMTVTKNGEIYTIDLVIKHGSYKAHCKYIGPLNINNGGQTGSNNSTSTTPDIILTSLSQEDSTLSGSNTSGDAITLKINSFDGVSTGYYEHISNGYSDHKGYFNVASMKVGGVTKSVKSSVLYIAKSGNKTTLHADITFEDNTTRHIMFDGEISTPTIEGDITLSASKSSIVGNGTDSVTFKIMQDGKDVTNQCNIYLDNTLISSPFSSTTPGTYTVYATKGAKRSNDVTITVTEYKPSILTLSASKTSLVADGSDSTTFSVKADNNIVTSDSTIYVNGTKINGSTFKTSSAGNYDVYAMYKGVKSNTLTITAKVSECVIVFAEGVDIASGWYDVNKMKEGNNGDTMMCWAAAASNMIQWWQDRYVATGNTLPAGAVTGVGTKMHSGTGFSRCYELALMDVFHSQWTNLERGGQPDYAISWYFEGKLNGGEHASNQAKPVSGGGYFKSVWSSIYPHLYHDYKDQVLPHLCYDLYTVCFNNYNLWGSKQGNEALAEFSNYVVTSIDRGVASLTIQPGSSALHAITLWGYEVDNATGLVTRIWVTDSDDQVAEPKTSVLNEYKVSVSGNKIKINGTTRYGECTIVDVIPLSGYGSAE